MPTPRDAAVEKLSSTHNLLADQVEQIIEGEIKQGNLHIVKHADQLPSGTNMTVLKLVTGRYRAVGWDVRAENDQRDGLYIVISGEGPA